MPATKENVDGRVKPGHDEEKLPVDVWHTSSRNEVSQPPIE
jgi:hypothetical protein